MRLTVLGGSAAGPNPGAGCSGYLVDTGTVQLVLDLGPGTLPELRRHADYRRLGAVVVSHLHLDHVLDLLALRFALAYNPVPAPSPLPLWLPPGGIEFLAGVAAAFAEPAAAENFFSELFAIAEYDPSQPLALGGGTTVTFSRTTHPVPCWAMRLTTGRADDDLVYTADTGPNPNLVPFAAGAHVAIIEATDRTAPGDPDAARVHLTPEEAGNLAREAGVRTLVVTHLWEEHGLTWAGERARSAFGGRTEVARPGLTLEW